jgi:hypothetical protein
MQRPQLSWGMRGPIGVFVQLVLVLLTAYAAAHAILSDDLKVFLLLEQSAKEPRTAESGPSNESVPLQPAAPIVAARANS